MSARPPAKRPCGSCPYRRDVPSGVWAPEEYEKLPGYDGATGDQHPAAFFCHQQDGRLCAGWVGCHDMDESMAIRILGTMYPDVAEAALNYECPVPLFESGYEAAMHGLAEVRDPSPAARRIIDRIQRKQGG